MVFDISNGQKSLLKAPSNPIGSVFDGVSNEIELFVSNIK
jgi:hypothetical protein